MNRLNAKCSAITQTLIGMAMLLATIPVWAGRPETTTTIDVPNAVVTVASGINGDGSIVGWYCLQLPCNAAHIRGFLLSNGIFTYIDVPVSSDQPAIGTQPRNISPQGVVIGTYMTLEDGASVAAPKFRGFAWYQGVFSLFDAPETTSDGTPTFDNPLTTPPTFAHSIIPRGINAQGQIVGCIHDKNQGGSMHGFVLSSETGILRKDTRGMTMNNGIIAAGDIVGLDGSGTTAYHIDKFGNEERLSFPGKDATDAWDIDERGEIVGVAWTNGATVQHAYLRSKSGNYRIIDPAGALSATAFGISSDGNVVGQYRDGVGARCSTTACVHGYLLHRGDD